MQFRHGGLFHFVGGGEYAVPEANEAEELLPGRSGVKEAAKGFVHLCDG